MLGEIQSKVSRTIIGNTKSCSVAVIDFMYLIYLKVSRIMVKRTNFPKRGTTREVGGMISARRRKNTVRESKMLIERLT